MRTLGAVVLILGILAAVGPAFDGSAAAAPGPTVAPGEDALSKGWADYKARFITPEGRVVDNANGDVSHSEGQGFGMLLAASIGDERVFVRVWNWTAHELYRRPDGLASWRWVPNAVPHVTDPNNATDGDLLIAWALLRAAKRWNSPEYRVASRRIAMAVGEHAVFQSRLGPALKPAVIGFDAADRPDGPVVNLSYWVFPALADLSEVAPEIDWQAVTRTGLSLLAFARFGPTSLPSDWISLAARPAPANGFPPVFSYDAVRIPLYLAWSGLGTLESYAPFLRLVQRGDTPAIVNVETGLSGPSFSETGYQAIFKLTTCAAGVGAGGSAGDVVASAVDGEHYYPSSLRLLAAVAARDRDLSCA